MEDTTVIRASSLPTWTDCERRWMASIRPDLVTAAGHELTYRPISIGAHVGSGSHMAVARSWQGKMVTGEFAPFDEAIEAGFETLKQRGEEEGVAYDQTTPHANAAQQAIIKIVRAYRADVRPDRMASLVEGALGCSVAEGYELHGHTDLFAHDGSFYDAGNGVLDDLKTGVRVPCPGEQLGAYDLLLEAKFGRPPSKATMTFVRRVRMSAEQPPPMTVSFDRFVIRKQARGAVKGIVSKLNDWRVDQKRDPFTFRANTGSFLCGAKYCRAFGSSWCPESQVKARMESV